MTIDEPSNALVLARQAKRFRSDSHGQPNTSTPVVDDSEQLPPFLDEVFEAAEASKQSRHKIQHRALISSAAELEPIRKPLAAPIAYPQLDCERPWYYIEHVQHEVRHVLKTVLSIVTDKNYRSASVATILSAFLGVPSRRDISHKIFVECLKSKSCCNPQKVKILTCVEINIMASESSWTIEERLRTYHNDDPHPEGHYQVKFVQHLEGQECDPRELLAWAVFTRKTLAVELPHAFADDRYKLLRQYAHELKLKDDLTAVTECITTTFIHEMAHLNDEKCLDVKLEEYEGGCYGRQACRLLARKRTKHGDAKDSVFIATESCQGPFENAESIALAIVFIYLTVARPDLDFSSRNKGLVRDTVRARTKAAPSLWRWKDDYVETFTPLEEKERQKKGPEITMAEVLGALILAIDKLTTTDLAAILKVAKSKTT